MSEGERERERERERGRKEGEQEEELVLIRVLVWSEVSQLFPHNFNFIYLNLLIYLRINFNVIYISQLQLFLTIAFFSLFFVIAINFAIIFHSCDFKL